MARVSTRRVLLEGTSWRTASHLAPLFVNIVLTPFVIHGLGTARYGLMLIISSVMGMLAVLDGGLGPASQRFFSLYVGAGDKRASSRLLVNLVFAAAALSALIFGGVFGFAPDIIHFFRTSGELFDEGVFLLRCLIIVVGLSLVRFPLQSLLAANHRYAVVSIADFAGFIAYTTGLVLSVVNGWGLYGIAWTFVVQQSLATLVIVPSAMRFADVSLMGPLTWSEWREFWRFAWKGQVVSIVTIVLAQKDQILAGRLIGAERSAPYGQGVQFSQQLRTLPMNAIVPIQSLVGGGVGEVGEQDSVAHFEKLQRIWVVLVTGWCALAIPASFFGVNTWLPQLHVAGAVAGVLMVGHMAYLIPGVAKTWALTVGQPGLELRYGVVTLVSNLLLTVAFAWLWGPMGSVVATSASSVIGLAYYAVAMRGLRTKVQSYLAVIPVLPAVVTTAVTWGLEYLANPFLPRGALGLLACAALAAPGMAWYLAWVFGWRESVDGARSIAARLRKR